MSLATLKTQMETGDSAPWENIRHAVAIVEAAQKYRSTQNLYHADAATEQTVVDAGVALDNALAALEQVA